MAVIIYTSDPPGLLRAIHSAIKDGSVATWSVDADGDFTHTAEQWRLKAWLRPKVRSDSLVFIIFPPQKVALSKATYAIYHGRFIEMLLAHFDNKFERALATALAAEGDLVKA